MHYTDKQLKDATPKSRMASTMRILAEEQQNKTVYYIVSNISNAIKLIVINAWMMLYQGRTVQSATIIPSQSSGNSVHS